MTLKIWSFCHKRISGSSFCFQNIGVHEDEQELVILVVGYKFYRRSHLVKGLLPTPWSTLSATSALSTILVIPSIAASSLFIILAAFEADTADIPEQFVLQILIIRICPFTCCHCFCPPVNGGPVCEVVRQSYNSYNPSSNSQDWTVDGPECL